MSSSGNFWNVLVFLELSSKIILNPDFFLSDNYDHECKIKFHTLQTNQVNTCVDSLIQPIKIRIHRQHITLPFILFFIDKHIEI